MKVARQTTLCDHTALFGVCVHSGLPVTLTLHPADAGSGLRFIRTRVEGREDCEIVAEMSQQARRSPHINQRSGVSVRLSIANYETLVANATRRALRHGETEVVPRVSDLDALVASTAGKVEFETVDDGREEQILDRIVKAAILETFRARTRPEKLTDVVTAFENGLVVHTGEDIAASEYAKLLGDVPALRVTLADLEVGETPAGVASAAEFVLEGLHLSKRLNKDALGGRASYRGRG